MRTLARRSTNTQTYIWVAIGIYVTCLGSSVIWLNSTSKLRWLSLETMRKSTVDHVYLQKNDTSVIVTQYKPVPVKANKPLSLCGVDINYEHAIAKLSDVLIDPKFGKGRVGGDVIKDVINQKETDEYYTLANGYFNLKCSSKFDFHFSGKSHLNNWFKAIKTSDSLAQASTTVSAWTIAIERHDYANLCMSMGAFYNAFLVTRIFHLNPNETNILFVDGHPFGALDSTWGVLFRNVSRVGLLKESVLYTNQVWSPLEYNSPILNRKLTSLPYIEDFRNFVLSRHNIAPQKALNCQKLKVLFLWRRDYLAHPRNPSGHVSRKIKNEDELLNRAKELLPGHIIEAHQIDKLTMGGQLELISTTDILIGMHGAGLAHALFLPKHAGLIEMYPKYWSNPSKFEVFCKWRKLHYSVWKNTDPKRELEGQYTIVDANVIMKHLNKTQNYMCGRRTIA